MSKFILFFLLAFISIGATVQPKKECYYYVDAINLDRAASENDKEQRF